MSGDTLKIIEIDHGIVVVSGALSADALVLFEVARRVGNADAWDEVAPLPGRSPIGVRRQ